jgi:hypothetical protein
MIIRSCPVFASIEILEGRIAPAAITSISLGDLNGANGFKLSGVAEDGNAGLSVSEIGDINADGFADVIVGAYRADEGGNERGAAYVVFGKPGGFDPTLSLSALDGSNGFKLSGIADTDFVGISVNGMGDINGDGISDLIVGAPGAGEGGNLRGAAYVIFGQKSGFAATVSLSTLNGSNGFKLSGAADLDYAGFSVSGAGDVNGDGFDDLIIGARSANEGGIYRGAAYVVFGRAGNFEPTLELPDLNGSNGFKLSGVGDLDNAGVSVSEAGDINGDGFDDLMVGAGRFGEEGARRGAVYVIFGKAGSFGAALELSALDGTNGFTIYSTGDENYLGLTVSGAGDVNGDGFADIIVGADGVDEGGLNRGAAYIVFGKVNGFDATLSVTELDGSDGFKLSGIADRDYAGRSVSGAGDVNGDGFDDIIVGASESNPGGLNSGAAYVVFGKAGDFAATLALSALNGSNGFRIHGASTGDFAGRSVSAAGDVNGDGFDDIIVGAFRADEGGFDRGAAFVVFGFGSAEVTVATNGKSATFTDWDGDLVTIKATKGTLDRAQFKLSAPNPLTGGSHLIYANFTNPEFAKANLTLTAKRGPTGGDGLINVGTLDARGVTLGRVSVDGDLQQIDAAGAAGLTVYSFGQFADAKLHGAPLASVIDGKLGALTVKTDASRVSVAAQTFGAIKAFNLDAVHLFAAGVANPAKTSIALAIKSLTVTGTVRDSQILAGYDATGAAVNADVQIGAVKVVGQWVASNLVAGVSAGDDAIFATGDANEALIPAGNAVVAKIASITIGGAAFGTSDDLRDGFGFSAEEIGSFKTGKAKLPLQRGAHNDTTALLTGLTGDLRVREVSV